MRIRFPRAAAALVAALTFVSCADTDYLRQEIERLKGELSSLEGRCDEMNAAISALEITVKALNERDYVTSVTEIKDADGDIQGYVIDFLENPSVTIWVADNPDKEPETIVIAPVVSARQDADGIYYWTSNGEFITDEKGEKVPVGKDGVTPELKVEEGKWYVSYDSGKTWEYLADVPEQSAPGYIFTGVDTSDPSEVVITLSDGSSLAIPAAYDGLVTLSVVDPDVEHTPGDLITITYTALKNVSVVVDDSDVESSEVQVTDGVSGTILLKTRANANLSKQRAFILLTYEGKVDADWRMVTFSQAGKAVISDIR